MTNNKVLGKLAAIKNTGKYEKYVRGLPCIICSRQGCDLLFEDDWPVPVCALHRSEYFWFGEDTFFERHGIDIENKISMMVNSYNRRKNES